MKNLSQNKGFALAFSLIFLFLVVSFVGAYFLMASSGLTSSNNVASLKKAFYVADAGLTDAFIQLRSLGGAPATFCLPAAYCADGTSSTAYSVGGGKSGAYSVRIASNGASIPTYTITSKGTFNGATKTLVLRVQQSSVSSFAYLSNTEIHPTWGALWWITGMATIGPVRTNGSLNIYGSPIFDGTTTQAGAAINYWSGVANNPQFVDGLTLSSATIPFPAATMLATLSSAASSSGLALTGNSTIVFNSNGTINVTNSAKSWSNKNINMPSNGIIYVTNGNATVKGTISGQATVATDKQLYISGNLVYKNDPRTDSTSTDLLGLVSKNDVTVLAASAPAKLELDAVLVALNGSFQVDNYWATGKGDMIQYGSLVNNYCGPTGVFDPGTGLLVGGYNQLQYYDTRLVTLVPPGFPPVADGTGRTVYVKLSFKEQ